MTRKKLIESLDREFSIFTRRVNSIDNMVKCFTCDKVMHWKESDCGHYMGRKNLSTRWEPDNANPQCRNCNSWLSGNIEVYTERLGIELAEELEIEAKKTIKWDNHELEQMLELYKKINKCLT